MPDFLLTIRRGIRLPPSGWMLAGMLAFYVLAGLLDRDPWKGEDAIHIATAWQMMSSGDWLAPMLAGRPFHEPPLYYWSAALFGHLFDWLLPAHEAMRLASGFWITLTLVGLYYASRELYGTDSAAASPLLLAGSIGLLVHAHEAQPILTALAAHAGALGAFASLDRKPRLAALIYGLAIATGLLGAGIAPVLPLLALAPFACWQAADRRQAGWMLLAGLAIASLLIAPWPLALLLGDPVRFHQWLATELQPLRTPFSFEGLLRFLAMLPWFAFPALPLALWTLWTRRGQWQWRAQALPLSALLITLLLLAWAYRPREVPALLLLPAIALLATPGGLSLRRGAANAFDWFAMSVVSFFVMLVWVAWSAMALGTPERLAQRVVALRPGFVGELEIFGLLVGLAATAWWIWLIITAPRSPYRSLTHWSMGITILWLVATALILPWFDYGKSYRPVAEAIAQALPADHGCVAERGLNDTQRASLFYFVGLGAENQDKASGQACDWLIVVSSLRNPTAPAGWSKVWEGRRPGERREKFILYRR